MSITYLSLNTEIKMNIIIRRYTTGVNEKHLDKIIL